MKLRIALIAVALLVIAAAGMFWKRAAHDAAIVGPAVPEVPDLSGVSAQLRDRVADADARAHSFWRAGSGLKELSRLYNANGQLAEALRCYETLRNLEPDEARWPHLEASILAGYGQADEATALWKRAVELAPDYLPARIRLGDIQLKSNRPAEAAASYKEVDRRSPGEPHAQLGLARLDLEAGRWEEARKRLEDLVAKTDYTLGYDLIVSLYERLGLQDRAAAIRGSAKASGAYRDPADPWLDDLMVDCYDSYRLALTAGTIARDGRAAEATALLRRAIAIAPDDVSAHFQLGMLAFDQRDFATASEELRLCTAMAPEFADGWAHLSDLQSKQGDVAGADRTLAEGLRECPQSPSLHLMRARRMRDTGRTGEAIVEFETSIRYRPNEADAYIELGTYLLDLGREAEAIRRFRRALEVEPGNPMALGILAFQAITVGDEPEARKLMELVRDQPRVGSSRTESLRDAYRQKFGRPAP